MDHGLFGEIAKYLMIQGTKGLDPTELSEVDTQSWRQPPELLGGIVRPGKSRVFGDAVRGSVWASPESNKNSIMEALKRIMQTKSGMAIKPPVMMNSPTKGLPLPLERAMSSFSDVHLPRKIAETQAPQADRAMQRHGITTQDLFDLYMNKVGKVSQRNSSSEQNKAASLWDKVFNPEGFPKPPQRP